MPGIGAQRGSGRGARRRNSTITAATAAAAASTGLPASPPSANARRAASSPPAHSNAPSSARAMCRARRTTPSNAAAAPNTAAPSSAWGSSSGASTPLAAVAVARLQPLGAASTRPNRGPTVHRGGGREHAPPAERPEQRAFNQAPAQRGDGRVHRRRGHSAEHGRQRRDGGPWQRRGDQDRRRAQGAEDESQPRSAQNRDRGHRERPAAKREELRRPEQPRMLRGLLSGVGVGHGPGVVERREAALELAAKLDERGTSLGLRIQACVDARRERPEGRGGTRAGPAPTRRSHAPFEPESREPPGWHPPSTRTGVRASE